jgi:hypothetical protein
MFRHRTRRPPSSFSDFINWNDYRWEANPWQRAASPRPWGHTRHRPRYNFLQILLAGVAVVVGVKLMSSMRNGGNRSWPEKAVIAVLILLVASVIQRHTRRRSW